jgi:hypothetical protein
MSVMGPVIRFFLEVQVANRSYDRIARQLQSSQKGVSDRIFNASEKHNNHKLARHIVGIERWGQHRLRCALGEPLVLDDVDGYILKESHSGGHIAQDFDIARRETLALVQVLGATAGIEKQKVQHNELGPLSVKGWLMYLNAHAEIESKKLR